MLFTILYSGDMTAQEAVIHFIITTFVFIFSLAMHEFMHGFVATKMGDDTPKLAGRLSLNPFKHLSTSGFLMFIIIGVGWAKPMPTNPLKYKKCRLGQRLVAVAGVFANLILGLISATIMAVLCATTSLTFAITSGAIQVFASSAVLCWVGWLLIYMMIINSCLFMFNIIPLFPLDGFKFVLSFIKSPKNRYVKFNMNYGTMVLYGIIIFSLVLNLFIDISLFDMFLNLLHDFIFMPIALLGV